jgi:hypothetical protein
MKKSLRQFALLALLLAAFALLGLPWWTAVLAGAALTLLYPANSAKAAFAAAFAAGYALWYGFALFQDSLNGSMFSTKIGEIFQGLKPWQLLAVTGLIGGLVTGMGALCGHFLRDMLVRPKPKRYAEKKRY